MNGGIMADWTDGWWTSGDGLRLHYRDYAGDGSRPPILCIPGLTRNCRDFESVAARLAGAWRLICVDLRGRGESAYAKDSATYTPLTYLQDIEALIASLGLARFAVFGTSLGGLVAMFLAMTDRRRLAAALLNDVGPELEAKGLDHIRTYVGRSQAWPTWLHAARALCEAQRERYPDWTLDQWLVFAKRVGRLTAEGRVVLDYDMRIADPIRQAPATTPEIDLWPAFRALDGVPALLVHGELSDLLSDATIERMRAEMPGLETVTIPRIGHAPTLEEPEAEAAIDRLLARIA
ncbi:MAG: alpha/beta hydrolase [Alphaproteobacteria bacterium]|nr:alpha/beta hydrolase [Alphaproteobacteria bacterium]